MLRIHYLMAPPGLNLKTASLWRRRLGGALPPSTTVTCKSFALRPPPLLNSSYTACSTGRALCFPCWPHRRWILPPTQSWTLYLRVSCWRRSLGPATSINQMSNQILYPAQKICMVRLTCLNNIQMFSIDIKDICMLYVFSHDKILNVWTECGYMVPVPNHCLQFPPFLSTTAGCCILDLDVHVVNDLRTNILHVFIHEWCWRHMCCHPVRLGKSLQSQSGIWVVITARTLILAVQWLQVQHLRHPLLQRRVADRKCVL